MMKPEEIVELLGLEPHPEGGWYRETWRAKVMDGARATGTAIYFLLERGQVSHWHRVDATEIWHWHAGAALELALSADGHSRESVTLGPGLDVGERPQVLVPTGFGKVLPRRGISPWSAAR